LPEHRGSVLVSFLGASEDRWSMLREIVLQDFNVMEFQLLLTDQQPRIYDPLNPQIWLTSEFSFSYEIMLWNPSTLGYNEMVLSELLVKNSTTEQIWRLRCLEMAHFRYKAGSINATMLPLVYNETFVAPDTDADFTTRTRLKLSVLLVCALCDSLLRLVLV